LVNVKAKKRVLQPEPLEQPAKEKKDKPWHQYQREPQYRLLEPGFAGNLDEDELVYVQSRLKADDNLSYWWGFRPGQKTRSEAAIRRIAQPGDPDSRAANVKLARTRRAETPAKSQRRAA
jgi:hypothetical protein